MTKKRIFLCAAVVLAVLLAVSAGTLWYMTRHRPNSVLMYHCISEVPQIVYDAGGIVDLYVTPADFENQLRWLDQLGYDTGFVSDYGKYYSTTDTFIPNEGVTVPEDYVATTYKEVQRMFTYSDRILFNDYYRVLGLIPE